MGYLNNQVGYREELLETRSIIKKHNYVVLEVDGLVKNSIPGFENCDITILGSPAMGATFVDYYLTIHNGGKHDGFGDEGIEVFFYVIDGEVKVKNEDEEAVLTTGGYIYSPAGKKISFESTGKGDTKVFLYKRRYDELKGYEAHTVVGNDNDLPWTAYEGMENCYVKDFLPSSSNLGFDMNMHILKFHLGASHGYVETHVQQHGMYMLSGKAMYRLDNEWVPIKKGDYVFMDSYCPQACYGVGKDEDLVYIYSKDCNRDIYL